MSLVPAEVWARGRGENTEVRADLQKETALVLEFGGGDDSDWQWRARHS